MEPRCSEIHESSEIDTIRTRLATLGPDPSSISLVSSAQLRAPLGTTNTALTCSYERFGPLQWPLLPSSVGINRSSMLLQPALPAPAATFSLRSRATSRASVSSTRKKGDGVIRKP